ncbi:DUF6415 family natural product biosynthesis protein [Streptomyces sp. bgisy100]|uniref:DUF6415 family natural product biosynthesis protein n=1 Tax=Streptomyces sp. bgisy100 TaxID=3413783 RepID=UPI003D741D3B
MATDKSSPARVDVDAIAATISRALAQRTALPPYKELCELQAELLEHIQLLQPLVEKHVNSLNRGTVDWYRKRCRLDGITDEVGQGLGSGLQSADWHVRGLGYACQFLLDNTAVVQPSDN